MNIEQGTRNIEQGGEVKKMKLFHFNLPYFPSLFNIPCSLFDIPYRRSITSTPGYFVLSKRNTASVRLALLLSVFTV
jgi:hypothetical protein